ncbi:hypothetical protein JL721_11498 [Aureococcus anophagefferens]|nr:hypothetical protein JL721_11498 [Aureococcus anophagefferens]
MSAAEKKIAQQRAAAKAAEKTGFLYAPVGWQREDMGRALYERGGLFKRVLRDARAGARAPCPRRPPRAQVAAEMYPAKDGQRGMFGDLIDTAHFAQPCLFAVEASLDALWRAKGVIPGGLLGHSIGELAAACSGNGGLPLLDFHGSLDDDLPGEGEGDARAKALARLRARRAYSGPLTRRGAPCRTHIFHSTSLALLMAQTPSAGCMMAVRASEKACSAAIDAVAAKCGSVVAVAAVNAPESTVLSGDYVAVSLVVAELAARNEARGADASKSKATKSAAARAAVGADREGDVGTKIHVASSVTGRVASRAELSGRALGGRDGRGPLHRGLRALAVKGICVFVEFGEGMLVGFSKDTLARPADQVPVGAVARGWRRAAYGVRGARRRQGLGVAVRGAAAKRRDAGAKRWHDLLPEAGREDLMPGFDDMVDEDTGVLAAHRRLDPKVGRKVFKHGYQCAESEPFPALEDGAAAALEGDAAEAFAARRELLAIIPPPRRVAGTFKLGVSLCGVPLYDGPLWNCDETRGVDVDTAAAARPGSAGRELPALREAAAGLDVGDEAPAELRPVAEVARHEPGHVRPPRRVAEARGILEERQRAVAQRRLTDEGREAEEEEERRVRRGRGAAAPAERSSA